MKCVTRPAPASFFPIILLFFSWFGPCKKGYLLPDVYVISGQCGSDYCLIKLPNNWWGAGFRKD